MKKQNKKDFGISIDSLLQKKQKLSQKNKDKYVQESKIASNQKERQQLKDSLFEEKKNKILCELSNILKKNQK